MLSMFSAGDEPSIAIATRPLCGSAERRASTKVTRNCGCGGSRVAVGQPLGNWALGYGCATKGCRQFETIDAYEDGVVHEHRRVSVPAERPVEGVENHHRAEEGAQQARHLLQPQVLHVACREHRAAVAEHARRIEVGVAARGDERGRAEDGPDHDAQRRVRRVPCEPRPAQRVEPLCPLAAPDHYGLARQRRRPHAEHEAV